MKVFLSIILLLSSFLGFSKNSEATLNKEKTIYLFSGLGADSSIFANLKLPGFHKVYINWIDPLPNETIPHYADRIRSQITEENPDIIGVSFGGMVAVEVSKLIEVNKMVLISSAQTKNELNRFQSFFMRMGFNHIVPGALLRHTNFLMYTYFGTHTPHDKKALSTLLKHTDITFFRWALKSIACWDNTVPPERTIQIHGTADRIIACRRVHPEYRIKGGGHLMVYTKADTISKIIVNYFGG
jgi:pimeloyl-ACP methyl ester carboxylesterase